MQTTTLTRKGQVTIPVEIRRDLGLQEGDQVAVERQGDVVVMRRVPGVAERTAGIFAKYRRTPPPSLEEERAAFEEAVAAEVAATDADET